MSNSGKIVDYLGYGTHAARPATPPTGTGVAPIYRETDTGHTFQWDGSAWQQVDGSTTPTLSVSTKTANYTITSTDDVILADATSGAFTVTLPTAVGWTKRITIKKIDSSANAVTVGTTSSQTIDGITTRSLAGQFASVTLISDNANWRVTELDTPLTSLGDLLIGAANNGMTRLGIGSTGNVLTVSGGTAVWAALPSIAFSAYICVIDQETAGTNGGTFTSGAWRTRTLNTKLADTGSNCTLASNQMSLLAGTYLAIAYGPGRHVDRHVMRLQNITDSTTLVDGEGTVASSTGDGNNSAVLMGVFTLAATKTVELQHQCQTTEATDGFGLQINSTFTVAHEVYAVIALFKQ